METTDATAAARHERIDGETSETATTAPNASAGSTGDPQTSPSAAEASAEATRAEPATETTPDASTNETTSDAPVKKASEPERTGRQSWTYAAAAVAYLIAPFLLGAALPPTSATLALLILLPSAALLLGLADGLVFRTTWAFPILTTILCFLGLRIYTNDGTWIYALGVLALTRVGTSFGGSRRTKG